jgi:RNA polymerase sigma-70 factor, ECF subfamily
VLQQDGEDFDALVRRYARIVSAAIRRVCGRAWGELVPDVEQEVYLTLWKLAASGKKIDRPASYLYKVALRTALAVVRKHGVEEPVDSAELEAMQAESATDRVAGESLAAERAQQLEAALSRLPAEQAQALRAYLRGLNHTEVAELHGWSESTARHRIYRGAEALKRMLREDGA